MYYRIIPYEQSFDTFGLIYKIPKKYQNYELIWRLWEFPFGKKIFRWVFIEKLLEFDTETVSYEIKEISWLVSEAPILTIREMMMIDFISKRYFCRVHLALRLYLSSGLLSEIQSLAYFSRKEKIYNYHTPHLSLNQKQQEVYKRLLNLPSGSKSLLYGVTWSGKTQIYIELIKKYIREEKQVLLLIPEIILTSQIGEKLQWYFWEAVILLHSWVSKVKKVQAFKDIASWQAQIIIGTRSTLFYPYKNLAYIIIDEEHDQSYISDSAPRYHSLSIAEKMTELYGASLLVASWTPQLTTMYKALSKEYYLFQLLESWKG